MGGVVKTGVGCEQSRSEGLYIDIVIMVHKICARSIGRFPLFVVLLRRR